MRDLTRTLPGDSPGHPEVLRDGRVRKSHQRVATDCGKLAARFGEFKIIIKSLFCGELLHTGCSAPWRWRWAWSATSSTAHTRLFTRGADTPGSG